VSATVVSISTKLLLLGFKIQSRSKCPAYCWSVPLQESASPVFIRIKAATPPGYCEVSFAGC
jgi:hypothetical protein